MSALTDAPGKIWHRIEKASTLMKLGLVLVSGYLVYRKYKKEVGLTLPPEITGGDSAVQPLTTPQAKALPAADPTKNLSYQTASPDQMVTAQLMNTAQQTVPLDPGALSTQALQTGTSQLLQSEGMEAKKANDVAVNAGNIFNSFLPS